MKFLGKNFIFSVKITNFLVFQDQMYIFGYKTTVFFYPEFVHFSEFFFSKTSFLA